MIMKSCGCSLTVALIHVLLMLCTHHQLMLLCEADVGAILTQATFDRFLSSRKDGPPCHSNFYTRSSFLAAASAFPEFATTGSDSIQKRELAAFFAHVAHETDRGCYTDQIGNNNKYHGRGPLQLTGQYNYQAAGDYLHVDLVNHPDLLSSDASLSFKSAIWFWMKAGASGTCHSTVVNMQGFGPTTRIINGGIECDGRDPENRQQDRIKLYLSFCSIFGISCQKQLSC